MVQRAVGGQKVIDGGTQRDISTPLLLPPFLAQPDTVGTRRLDTAAALLLHAPWAGAPTSGKAPYGAVGLSACCWPAPLELPTIAITTTTTWGTSRCAGVLATGNVYSTHDWRSGPRRAWS